MVDRARSGKPRSQCTKKVAFLLLRLPNRCKLYIWRELRVFWHTLQELRGGGKKMLLFEQLNRGMPKQIDERRQWYCGVGSKATTLKNHGSQQSSSCFELANQPGLANPGFT